MAGSRCANPEYQLEVDTMMIEYVLFKTIDANLQLLTMLSTNQEGADDTHTDVIVSHADTASRLVETYDVLITSYKKNHGDTLKDNARRNSQLLRFLVQLNAWEQSRVSAFEKSAPESSSAMQERIRRDMIINRVCRCIWLSKHTNRPFPVDWRSLDNWRLRNSKPSLVDHLLPLFMWISLDLFRISKQPHQLNLEWVNLATSLMVQAAIEILEAPDLFAAGVKEAQNALEECFAWGRLDRCSFEILIKDILGNVNDGNSLIIDNVALTSAAKLEDLCQAMFDEHMVRNNVFNGTAASSKTGSVIWRTVRQEVLDDVLMTFTSMQEVDSTNIHRPLELLREKYRLQSTLESLNEFIAIHWRLLHTRGRYGKPVLVQIEEGGIEGLTAEDFEEFKKRAHIQDMWESAVMSDDE